MSVPGSYLEARRIAKSLGFAITLYRGGDEPVDVRHADDADVRARLTDEASGAARDFTGWREAWQAAAEQAADEVGDTPETRRAAFAAAMAAGDATTAHAIARAPLPADWPEDVRRPWGARRDLARMALHGGEGAS